jgi:two-component system response regulator VanR
VGAPAVERSEPEHEFSELERLREVVVGAEELLERAWDENADSFTNAVRITVSGLRKRLGEPWLIATVPGVGYRIDAGPDAGGGEGDDG